MTGPFRLRWTVAVLYRVDRLLHHAHVGQTTGTCVRLSQALAGHGVVSPLT